MLNRTHAQNGRFS